MRAGPEVEATPGVPVPMQGPNDDLFTPAVDPPDQVPLIPDELGAGLEDVLGAPGLALVSFGWRRWWGGSARGRWSRL